MWTVKQPVSVCDANPSRILCRKGIAKIKKEIMSKNKETMLETFERIEYFKYRLK